MKYLISLLLLLTINISLSAQDRLIKKSGPKPKWINNVCQDYIIAYGSGESIELAKEDALSMVKEQIVRSIAERVIANSEMTKTETSVNNKGESIIEQFKSRINTKSGKIDFLNGININNAEKFYWEILKNRATKKIKYHYYLKYPFSRTELQELVYKYKKKDDELTRELDKYLSIAENIKSTEEIASTISALNKLRTSFVDRRQDKADLTIEKLRSMYKEMDIKILEETNQKLVFALCLNDQKMETSKRPIVKSEWIRIVKKSRNGLVWEVQFDAKDCYPEEDNNIRLSLALPGNKIRKTVSIDVSQAMAKLSLVGDINVKQDTLTNTGRCSITLRSKYASPLCIESIKLNFNGSKEICFNDFNKVYKGGGIYNIELDLPQNTVIEDKEGEINGLINYKSVNSEKKLSCRIYKCSYNITQ